MLSHDILIQLLMPDCSVVACDICVLLRLSWFDVLDGDTLLLSPYFELFTDIFRAIVDPDGTRLAAPLDDAVQASDDPFSWEREIHLDPQPCSVKVV